jgi:hypothetical protein
LNRSLSLSLFVALTHGFIRFMEGSSDSDMNCPQDAEVLRAVVDQLGTLVVSHAGEVLSSSGELQGVAGETAAKAILSILQVRGSHTPSAI